MQTKTIGIIVVITAIVGGYFLLNRGYQAPLSNPTPAPTTTPEKTGEPTRTLSATQAPAVEVAEINVVGNEFSFSPENISVKAGEKVKINFKNSGRAPHNLIIEKLGIGTKTISGGQTDVVEFTVPSSGTYAFFCSVPGHRSAGMEGSLKTE